MYMWAMHGHCNSKYWTYMNVSNDHEQYTNDSSSLLMKTNPWNKFSMEIHDFNVWQRNEDLYLQIIVVLKIFFILFVTIL